MYDPCNTAHVIDDLEIRRTRYRRDVRESIDVLGDALVALRNGDTSVTEEFLDRTLTRLTRSLAADVTPAS